MILNPDRSEDFDESETEYLNDWWSMIILMTNGSVDFHDW